MNNVAIPSNACAPDQPVRRRLAVAAVLAWAGMGACTGAAFAAEPPALLLANRYRAGLPLEDYWVSEKLDGVRGYWDGQVLRTRGGERIAAPQWFTARWPRVALDGELWAGRGRFAQAVSTVRQQTPDDAAWRNLRFMVFDLPGHGGTFTERIPALLQVVAQIDETWVRAVAQSRAPTHAALMALLDKTVRAGGEGLMLHRGSSLYRGTRSDDLLKLKTHDDAEARVLGHEPGRGKYQGLVGALLVETPEGHRLRIGSGLSDADRRTPPAVGSWITYRFRGRNDSGIPRFATYLRPRGDWNTGIDAQPAPR